MTHGYVQYNMGPGGAMYAPHRDLARTIFSIIRTAEGLTFDAMWPALKELCKEKNVSDDDLAEALHCMCKFISFAFDPLVEDHVEALKRAGWDDVKPEAKMVLGFYVGTVTLATAWSGIRELFGDEDREADALKKDLERETERISNFMFSSNLRKKWVKFKNWIVGLLKAR